MRGLHRAGESVECRVRPQGLVAVFDGFDVVKQLDRSVRTAFGLVGTHTSDDIQSGSVLYMVATGTGPFGHRHHHGLLL